MPAMVMLEHICSNFWAECLHARWPHSQCACQTCACNAAQLLEWWYTSAEEKLAAEQKLEPPPPPPPPLPSPQGVPLPSDPSICPLCRQVRTTAEAGAIHALTDSV